MKWLVDIFKIIPYSAKMFCGFCVGVLILSWAYSFVIRGSVSVNVSHLADGGAEPLVGATLEDFPDIEIEPDINRGHYSEGSGGTFHLNLPPADPDVETPGTLFRLHPGGGVDVKQIGYPGMYSGTAVTIERTENGVRVEKGMQ